LVPGWKHARWVWMIQWPYILFRCPRVTERLLGSILVHRILHEVTMRFVGVISQVSIGVQKNRINPDLDGMYDPSLLDLGTASVGFGPLQKDQTAVTRAFDGQVRPRRLSAAVLDMSSSHIRQKP
jgi:hypothetical protein